MFGFILITRTMSVVRLPAVISRLVTVAAIAWALLAAGCASSPGDQGHVPAFLFADQHFRVPSEPIAVDRIFVVSESMRDYLRTEFRPGLIDQQTALAEALYQSGRATRSNTSRPSLATLLKRSMRAPATACRS